MTPVDTEAYESIHAFLSDRLQCEDNDSERAIAIKLAAGIIARGVLSSTDEAFDQVGAEAMLDLPMPLPLQLMADKVTANVIFIAAMTIVDMYGSEDASIDTLDEDENIFSLEALRERFSLPAYDVSSHQALAVELASKALATGVDDLDDVHEAIAHIIREDQGMVAALAAATDMNVSKTVVIAGYAAGIVMTLLTEVVL